jgi:peptidoglycan/LPS O-acetylase OafA/YrhL
VRPAVVGVQRISETAMDGPIDPIGPSQMRALTPAASAHLDLIRGIAAWAVMWEHARALFFVSYRQLQNPTPAVKVIYFFTGFGHAAVMVFFVLSGFLISSAILGRRASGNWSWRDYAIDRSSRLYVVLIPGLLFGLLWDKAGSSLFNSSGIYSQVLDGFGLVSARHQLTFGNFVGNLFFLQTIVCPQFGSNAPLWSLANEFWYYVLFPVALASGIAWTKKSVRSGTLLTCLGLAVAIFVRRDILLGFLVWLTGTILVVAYSRWRFSGKPWFVLHLGLSSIVLIALLTVARMRESPWIGSDFAIGLAFSAFLFGVLQLNIGIGSRIYLRAAHFLSGFSYSLYVLHFPLLLFMCAWLVPAQKWQPDPIHLVYGVALGAAVLVFAWFVSKFTEDKTRVVRQWMRNVIPTLDSRKS